MASRILYLAFILFAAALPAAGADTIYNCDGAWTNKPCASPAQVLTEEKRTRDPQQKLKSDKNSLLHELRQKAAKAKKIYGAEFDLAQVEDFCAREEATLADCRSRVETMNARIDKRVGELALARGAEPPRGDWQSDDHVEVNQPNVVINQGDVIVVPRRHRGYYDGWHGPGQRHSGAGVSVTTEGRVGGADLTIHGGAGTSGTAYHPGGTVVPVKPRHRNVPPKVKPGPFAR